MGKYKMKKLYKYLSLATAFGGAVTALWYDGSAEAFAGRFALVLVFGALTLVFAELWDRCADKQ